MALRKKPGPKTPWQRRVRYNRARCVERLKPTQIENLTAADAFAGTLKTPLNGFLTIKFSERCDPLQEFHAATKRLWQWHRRWGGELRMAYVWEAIGGHHLHALVHVPRGAWQLIGQAFASAFAGHDTLLKRRYAGPSMMAYLCKGTDLVTHWQLGHTSHIKAKAQGSITWKRCGTTANIGRAARTEAQNNCAQTCTKQSHKHEHPRTNTNSSKQGAGIATTYVVSKPFNSHLEAACGAAHTTQAPAKTPNRRISVVLDPCESTGHDKSKQYESIPAR